MQCYVYLVLSSSNSIPAKIIKRVCKNEINHSSITIDPTLNEMYSFGRIFSYIPFYGGFVCEGQNKGFYKRFKDTYIKVYRLLVSDEVYNDTKNYLLYFCENKASFGYNYLGMFLQAFEISIIRESRYFCSEFVADVLKKCNIREINYDVHSYRPYFFEELSDKELIYEGIFADYDYSIISSIRNIVVSN